MMMADSSAEVDCRGCGYNLRGVAVEGACPECGAAVLDSLRTHALEASDPRWLNRLAIGSRLLAIAAGAWLAVLLALLAVSGHGSDTRAFMGSHVLRLRDWLISWPRAGRC